MPDQAVEIKGAGSSHMNLVVSHLVDGFQIISHLQAGGGGFFKGGGFRHVQNDLKFAFVVKGKHLDLDPADAHHRAGHQQHGRDSRQKYPAPESGFDQGGHDFPVKPGAPVFGFGVTRAVMLAE